jgi:Tfp pilus assembly protein PilN
MEWWVILLIVAGVLVLAAVLWLGGTRARAGRLETRRAEAGGLRRAAQAQAQRAEERERLAEEQAERARQEREAARSRLERADDLDPDVDR